MALSAGSQHMNLLQTAEGAEAYGSGGSAVPAVGLGNTSTAMSLALEDAESGSFAAGQMIAVDADFLGETGFVGSGVSAAYVRDASAIRQDADYIRRVTFNVARIARVSDGQLELSQPLIAGPPIEGMKVQRILGFVDREGGAFFQEWSGLFVMAGEQGERIILHYPRLQACAVGTEAMRPIAGPIERVALAATFRALPVMDANDGEQVICYRSFLPADLTLL